LTTVATCPLRWLTEKVRRQHLGHGVDGHAGQDAVLVERERQERNQQREQQDHRHAQDCGQSYGARHIAILCVDDRRHGCDGGVAADRIADSHQQGELVVQAQETADQQTSHDPRQDAQDNGQPDGRARPNHGRQIYRRPQEHDRRLQYRFGHQVNPGRQGRTGAERVAPQHPEQQGDHQTLEDRVADDLLFCDLNAHGQECERDGQSDAGEQLGELREAA
jgi:hypothetical protein